MEDVVIRERTYRALVLEKSFFVIKYQIQKFSNTCLFICVLLHSESKTFKMKFLLGSYRQRQTKDTYYLSFLLLI